MPTHHRKKAPAHKTKAQPRRPATLAARFRPPNQYIDFYGDSGTSAPSQHIAVLAGDGAPTMQSGYAKWQVIDRPLHRGLTVFQGYDPISMSFPIRFISWDQQGLRDDDGAGAVIERNIWALEKMAGVNLMHGDPPPVVYLSTYNANGDAIPLIPFQLQLANTRNVPQAFRSKNPWPWIIQSLVWDPNPQRNANGYRIRQDATVTTMYWSGLGAAPSSAALRKKGAKRRSSAFRSRVGADTPLEIAAAVGTPDRVRLADAIRGFPQNHRLHLRSNHQKIAHGAVVRVPEV